MPCTAIENDAERLACYDRALRATAPPAPAAQAPSESAAPRSAATEPAASAPAAAPAPATTTAAAATAAREEEQRTASVTIVGVSAPQGRPATFTTSDGTTWVQTDSQRVVGLPATPFTAEIKSGAMSSYFLVPEGRRAIRVRTGGR